MSVFKGHDVLSLNRYYYSFYSFSQDDPNTIKSFVYDHNQTLVSSKDISFQSRNIRDMLRFLENSENNPYALGKSNDEFLNMDIAFAGVYKKALTENQQQSLMTTINKTYKNVYRNIITTYEVKVVSSIIDDVIISKYSINDVEQPNLEALLTGNYIFDQSHPSNAGHLLKFRSLGASYTTNVIHEGTPGTPGSYTLIDVTQSTPVLQYYCQVHTDSMYGEFKYSST